MTRTSGTYRNRPRRRLHHYRGNQEAADAAAAIRCSKLFAVGDAKSEGKSETKAESKADSQTETKPESKSGTKKESKPAAASKSD